MTSKIQDLTRQNPAPGGRLWAPTDPPTAARCRFGGRPAARHFATRAREIGAGARRQANPADVVVTIR